jgi:hypothetical protein
VKKESLKEGKEGKVKEPDCAMELFDLGYGLTNNSGWDEIVLYFVRT